MLPSVLVCDDSAVARLAVARRVRAEGREVVESDSVAASAAVDASTLACALLDLDLGDGFGTAVAERLRGANAELPIAFFTSEPGGELVERAKTFGPIFTKPVELERAIAWVLDRSSAAG